MSRRKPCPVCKELCVHYKEVVAERERWVDFERKMGKIDKVGGMAQGFLLGVGLVMFLYIFVC